VAGDVITAINGQPVATPVSLGTLVGQYHPGDVVSLTWTARRGATRTSWTAIHGATHTTQITLGNGPFQ